MGKSKVKPFKHSTELATFLKQHSPELVEQAYLIYIKSRKIHKRIKQSNVE
ncbi:MAG: hypothetical protein ACOC56_04515 [Atribacterota bacterium]